jgi:hypothetical protein
MCGKAAKPSVRANAHPSGRGAYCKKHAAKYNERQKAKYKQAAGGLTNA